MKLRDKTNKAICSENAIKIPFQTNIVEEQITKNKIKATLEIIAKTLCGTLGPYGETCIIQDRAAKDFASKDGYDLMNRISFDDEVARTILNLVRQIASSQALNVGDGTTSSIIIANALYSELTSKENQKFFQKVAGKDVTDILNDFGKILEREIKPFARPVSEDMHELDDIASISLNNDRETGSMVAEIYKKIGKYGFVSTDVLARNEKDAYEIKKGIEWKRGYIDQVFADVNNGDNKVVYNQNPKVILFKTPLTHEDIKSYLLPLIQVAINQEGQELLIVANDYSEDVKVFLKSNRIKHRRVGGAIEPELIYTAVDIDQVTRASQHNLEDLGTLLGCTPIDKYKISPAEIVANKERFIGVAEKIVVTAKTTQIIAPDFISAEAEERKEEVLKRLREELEELMKIDEPTMDEDNDIYELKRRISNLTDSTAVFKVGGKTQTERAMRERLVEDAIFACKSALEYGVIPGGNLTIPRIIKSKKLEICEELAEKYSYLPLSGSGGSRTFIGFLLEIVAGAFIQSYRDVLNNSYMDSEETEETIKKCLEEDLFFNLKTHKYEKVNETPVINSLMTDVQIMSTTFSIIGILATSNQFLTLNLHLIDEALNI